MVKERCLPGGVSVPVGCPSGLVNALRAHGPVASAPRKDISSLWLPSPSWAQQVSTGLPPPVPRPRGPHSRQPPALVQGPWGGPSLSASPSCPAATGARGGGHKGERGGRHIPSPAPRRQRAAGPRAPGRPQRRRPGPFIESSSAGRDSIKKPFAAACWPPAVPPVLAVSCGTRRLGG